MKFHGRTAIVTGGNRGIGRAIARALAAEGASCVLCARDQHRLASVERGVGGRTPGAMFAIGGSVNAAL